MKAQIKVITLNGFTVTLETPDIDRHELLTVLPKFEAELIDLGYKPAPTLAATNQPPSDVGSFPADSLVPSVLDGKTYWKVKGGQYQKFGVTVWPEILEAAGIEPQGLDPLDLTGWVAHYLIKDGQPKKVVKLEKVG